MLKTPELAMPRTNEVTTIYNGKHEVWTDYEEAKAYFLELMMSTDGEEHDRTTERSVYISSFCTGWMSIRTKTERSRLR